jgi:hypothetical protein
MHDTNMFRTEINSDVDTNTGKQLFTYLIHNNIGHSKGGVFLERASCGHGIDNQQRRHNEQCGHCWWGESPVCVWHAINKPNKQRE